MKKLVLILAVLAAPAMATVTLSLDNHGNADGVVDIKYSSTGQLPRAFALNVSVDEGTITGYVDSTTDGTIQPFNVYMGNIQIDGGVIVSRGSPVAPYTAPDTPQQLPAPTNVPIVIEMGSLYVPGTSDPCEPAASGILIRLICSSTATTCDMTVTSNALRGKIVNEDTTVEDRFVSGPVNAGIVCAGVGPATQAEWDAVGNPQSWCNQRQCHGDASNSKDGTPKGGYFYVQEMDLNILVAGWKKAYTNPTLHPWIAADFNRHMDGTPKGGYFRVQEMDLNILVAYWKDADALVPADCQ